MTFAQWCKAHPDAAPGESLGEAYGVTECDGYYGDEADDGDVYYPDDEEE